MSKWKKADKKKGGKLMYITVVKGKEKLKKNHLGRKILELKKSD